MKKLWLLSCAKASAFFKWIFRGRFLSVPAWQFILLVGVNVVIFTSLFSARGPEWVEIEGAMFRVMPRGSLGIEHFLEDLDYMVYVLENNFALLEVAKWAHGADYRQLAANARESVLSMEEPCEEAFLAMLVYHFYPLRMTGHFLIFGHRGFHSMRNSFYGGYHLLSTRGMMNYRLMHSPLANRFYDRNPRRITAFWSAFDELELALGQATNRFSGDWQP